MSNFNSDGYIMIDLSDVDVTKSTQNVPGIYSRILNVIDANKLILIVNHKGLTPQAAICNKMLNYYVITTNLYIYKINSNDIVIIEQAGSSSVEVSIIPTLMSGTKIADFAIGSIEGSLYAPEFESEINDNVTASNSTWSSDKIDGELALKADAADLAEVATTGSYNDLSNKPTIPTKTSDLTNDSGFITDADVPTIDDTTTANNKVWSSLKTSNELALKSDATAVYTKTEVDNALSNKQDTLTVQTGTMSGASGTTIVRQTLLKFGNVVFLTCDLKVDTVVRWATFATLPSGFKPTNNNIYTVAINTGSSSGVQNAHVQISTGGYLAFGNTLPDANVQYSISVAWIVN